MPLKNPNAVREWFNTIFYGALIAIIFRSFLLEPFNIPSGSMIPTLHVGDHIFVEKWSYGYSRYSFPFGSWHLFDGRFLSTEPDVGDVIVFRYPLDESVDFVKRLIGLPGDKVQMRDGRLYINGKIVKRENPRRYVVAVLSKANRGVEFHKNDMIIKGNKIWVNNEPADFNYTIQYVSDEYCQKEDGDWCKGSFDGIEYTEILPNGVKHSIVEVSDNYVDAGGNTPDNTPEITVPDGHYFFMGDDRDNSSDGRFWGFVPRDNMLGKVWFIWYSHNYYAPMPFVWTWGNKMRWDRIGNGID